MLHSAKYMLILFCCLWVKIGYAQTISENQKLESLCRVWGFLKYHHPQVATGKLNWDKELLQKIDELKPLQTKEEVSRLYLNWINSLGPVPAIAHPYVPDMARVISQPDTSWFSDTTAFSPALCKSLAYIYHNRNQGANHYIRYNADGIPSFKHEKIYMNDTLPNQGLRLLCLFRYWNIIQYFFPYKNLTDTPWDTTLKKFIPIFLNAEGKVGYAGALFALTAATNDSHSMLWEKKRKRDVYESAFWGKYLPPVLCKIFPEGALVTKLTNDTLANRFNLCKGDIIEKVDGVPIANIVAKQAQFIAASNKNTLLRDVSYMLLCTKADTMCLSFKCQNKDASATLSRWKTKGWHRFKEDSLPSIRLLNDSVAYINAGRTRRRDIRRQYHQLAKTKAIIIDSRNYPMRKWLVPFARLAMPDRRMFAVSTISQRNNPGLIYQNPRQHDKSLWCGPRKPNRHPYTGKIVQLVNEESQSFTEFYSMALQTLPNTTTIGSQTAGADGDAMAIALPGGVMVSMSSTGTYYPDGTQTQRVGIKIDITVEPTIKGLQAERDEVLDRALEFLSKGR